jgi:predicted nucleic acid-binding protein
MAGELRILVDLNVIVDVVQDRRPYYEESARVLDAVARRQADGWVAAHSLTTLFYVIARLRKRETAVTALGGLLESFRVAGVDEAVIRRALSWGWRDFEDAVQMAAAVEAGVDYLITRNVSDFEAGPIPVIQPAAFLALLNL